MNTHQLRNASFSLFTLFAIVLSLGFANFAQAQNSAGIGIIPAVIDPIELFQPGETRRFSVKVSNLSDRDQNYYLSKRDIIGVRDGGIPLFSDANSPITGYELSDWIKLNVNEIFVPARGNREVTFDLVVPQEVSPGSHFGSIIFSVDPPKLRASGAGVGYEVANIISIRIVGEVEEIARIRQFSTSKYIYGSTNVDFNARIENEGNTLIKPTGPLEVVNMFGKKVALLQFNESQAAVFPKTTRDYNLVWTDESPGFGRYEALLSVVYGIEGKYDTVSSTVTFWILPMNIIIPALGVLAVILLIIYISVRIYIKRTVALSTSGSTRRLVRSRKQAQFPKLLVFISMLAVTALFFIILLLIFS